ncbi:hypothetical protein [Vitiosangium sp. GDMCC 1.1324]|uniref:hypothetical protein n=1 Tax=Vitiosangium sp. (strain GDMCC 1.1324) TaxID=2138576 RepID=UPI000D3332FF|nr:hypothetical protein [Vitiosangium sp. GDMCC 1.1324]PTL78252.1 hypothetical protein DAT35_40060 [Vitiosangium sp. GDMCC 1.1324]
MPADPKSKRGNASRKALNALEGDDEFSVFSVDPDAYKPPVSLKDDTQGRPDDTRATSSVVRFLRKIFGD